MQFDTWESLEQWWVSKDLGPVWEQKEMTNKQLQAVLDLPMGERFEAWKFHCSQVVNGYDKIDSRLLSRINEDMEALIQRAGDAPVQLVAALDAHERQVLKDCANLITQYHRANGILEDVTDKLLALLCPEEEDTTPIVLPSFGSIDAGGYGT